MTDHTVGIILTVVFTILLIGGISAAVCLASFMDEAIRKKKEEAKNDK